MNEDNQLQCTYGETLVDHLTMIQTNKPETDYSLVYMYIYYMYYVMYVYSMW